VPAPDAATDLSASDHENYVFTRRGELTQMGMSDDPSDLKTILSELNNKDPEVRQAALSATIQFGSQDAIPALQNEMAWTDDPQEKVDLQKAIKYLQLPTFQEFKTRLAGTATEQSDGQPPPAN
jgi:HEAT repeat protein